MPRLTSFDRVCCPRAFMSCHARRCRPCVLSQGGDVMPRLTLSDRACSPRAVISCHARCHSTECAVQGPWFHATPDVIRLSVLSIDGDGMSRLTSSDRVCFLRTVMACHARRCPPCVLSKGSDVMPCSKSSDRVCSLRAVMASPTDDVDHVFFEGR